jgi:hypothetical protein
MFGAGVAWAGMSMVAQAFQVGIAMALAEHGELRMLMQDVEQLADLAAANLRALPALRARLSDCVSPTAGRATPARALKRAGFPRAGRALARRAREGPLPLPVAAA